MRKKDEEGYEAKRKRQQRDGYFSLNGVMAPPSLKKRMIVEGFLAEAAKDNPYAVMSATERWIERQLLLPPELPDTVTNPKVEKRRLTKAKRRERTQHGPGYRIAPTPELERFYERQAWEDAGCPPDREEWEREWERERLARKEEQERKDLEFLKKAKGFSIEDKERREAARRRLREDTEAVRQKEQEAARKSAADKASRMIETFKPQAPKKRSFQSYGKSGVSKRGGKPIPNGLPSASYGTSQYKQVKPIKQLTTKQLDERIQEKFGPLSDPDSSPHFVPMSPAEAAYKLDRFEAEDEGFGRGGKPRIRDFQGDDGFTKPGAKLFDGDN